MKGFTRKNPYLSLCGLNCKLCSMNISGHWAAAALEISPVRLPDAVWNTGTWSIVSSAQNTRVSVMRT